MVESFDKVKNNDPNKKKKGDASEASLWIELFFDHFT